MSIVHPIDYLDYYISTKYLGLQQNNKNTLSTKQNALVNLIETWFLDIILKSLRLDSSPRSLYSTIALQKQSEHFSQNAH